MNVPRSEYDADALASAPAWTPRELAPRPAPTIEELDEMVRLAREEGYEEGRNQGYADGMAQARGEQRRLAEICSALAKPVAELEEDVAQQLLELSIAISRAVSRVQLAWDTGALMEVVREALAAAGADRSVELRLHPGDVPRVDLALEASGVSTLPRLVADPALAPGDVRVHGESLRLDATLDTRLAGVAAVLAGRARSD
jgi:flagellar assembly protein FliH